MDDNSGDQGRLPYCVVAGLSLVVAASLATGCSGGNEPDKDRTATDEVVHGKSPSLPPPVATVTPVGRAELLAAAAAAADETAGGNPLPKANLQLIDRTFELRLPIGCGRGNSADWGEWSIDPSTRVLRISVRSQVWTDDQTVKRLAANVTYDVAEGFWVDRPWTRSEKCPPPMLSAPTSPQLAGGQQATTTPEVPPSRTFAIVQYFSPDAPRNLRRGSRPYSYTGKVPQAESVEAKAYRLKLTGRISGFGDGQPIHCVVLAAHKPPTCAAAVEFTQVVLEDAATGESLAEWNS